jgi:DNA (cytosine-5)-methyltransferase 1
MRRYFAESRKAREEVATAIGASAGCKGYRMTAFGEYADDDTASKVKARDYKDATDLVLNDQGGSQMDVSYGVTATLRSQEHGHQSLILFEPRSQDGCLRIHDDISPTLNTAQGGQRQPCIAIQGNMIGRADKNDPNGPGINENVCFTLNATDQHAVAFDWYASSRESLPVTKECPPLRATMQPAIGAGYVVRRLTPTECERLQGYPDNWTAGGSDTQRYKALGNSVAVPCVRFVLGRAIQYLNGGAAIENR